MVSVVPVWGDCLEEKQPLRTLAPVFLQKCGPASKLSLLGCFFFTLW